MGTNEIVEVVFIILDLTILRFCLFFYLFLANTVNIIFATPCHSKLSISINMEFHINTELFHWFTAF